MAKAEFMRWFEAKKFSKRVLEKHDDDMEAIVDAIQQGILVLNEDMTFTHKLQFPLQSGEVSELTYKFRITEGELAASMKGLKTDDFIGQMPIAYVSALTGQNRGIIRALDHVDISLSKHIAAFFSV